MKKVYMPSDDILLQMQEYGGNIYQYLMVKALETLLVEGVNYPNKGILKTAYKYIREDPYLANAICLLYPEEIKYSETASYDAALAIKLISRTPDKRIYNLDKLVNFDDSVGTNTPLIRKTVDILDEYLINNPTYRFEYKETYEGCQLLNDIFSTKLLEKNIFWSGLDKAKMARIEPAYALLIPTVTYQDDFLELTSQKQLLKESMYAYAARYDLEDVEDKPVDLKNLDEKTKRLIRCIKNDKRNLY